MYQNKTKLFSNVTIPIIIANVLCFIIQQFSDVFTNNLLLVSSDILFRPWILISSMFLHGSMSHLFFNMYALLLFGSLIESRIGARRFLYLYFSSGLIAALGFAFFHEIILGQTGRALGASGGMMGILGMTIILLPNMKVLFFFVIPMSMRTAGIIFALVDLLGVFGIGIRGIANIAHLFGLITGLLYGLYILKTKVKFQKRFVRPSKVINAKNITPSHKNSDIHLSKEDIDDFVKNGRL